MANPNPNIDNLKSYKQKWLSGKTQTIRVPIAIAEEVMIIAHKIDKKQLSDTSDIINNQNKFSKQELFKLANKVLNQKKSARLSLEKFLQELLEDKTIKL